MQVNINLLKSKAVSSATRFFNRQVIFVLLLLLFGLPNIGVAQQTIDETIKILAKEQVDMVIKIINIAEKEEPEIVFKDSVRMSMAAMLAILLIQDTTIYNDKSIIVAYVDSIPFYGILVTTEYQYKILLRTDIKFNTLRSDMIAHLFGHIIMSEFRLHANTAYNFSSYDLARSVATEEIRASAIVRDLYAINDPFMFLTTIVRVLYVMKWDYGLVATITAIEALIDVTGSKSIESK